MTYNTSKLLHQLHVGLQGLRKAFVKPQFYLFRNERYQKIELLMRIKLKIAFTICIEEDWRKSAISAQN